MSFTVEKFATELGLPVDLLLEQLKSAGVNIAKAEDALSEEDKSSLLRYLQNSHGGEQKPKSKITLTRKQNTEIKKTDLDGRRRTIQVEVRKKRTIVKPESESPQPVEAKSSKPTPVVDENQRILREDEAKRQAALAEAQASDVKVNQDKKEKDKKEKEIIEKHRNNKKCKKINRKNENKMNIKKNKKTM